MSIEIRQLQKSFGEKHVLKGIGFQFEKGKVNMIIGASGSGKSVTLKCIVGLMQPDSGQVLFDNQDFYAASYIAQREIRRNIGMLFQGSALFDSLNVEQNIRFPLDIYTQQSPKEKQQRVDEVLELVNLVGANKKYPSEISGGMKKRVGIARAIAMNPKYLFVDEPNSGLDPLTSTVIDKLIAQITQEYNMTTVVVSHDMNSVMNIGDKIMFVYQGAKEWEGTKHDILRPNNPHLEEFIFVSDLIRRD